MHSARARRSGLTGFVLLFPFVCGACSAALDIKRIDGEVPATFDGLVVNQPVPHDLLAILPQSATGGPLTQRRARAMLPARHEFYIVGYDGALFRSNKLEVELHPDSSLKKVTINSDLQAAEALGTLTTAAQGVAGLRQELAEKDAAEPLPIDEENALLQKELQRLMLLENKKAAAEGRELPYPDK